jgi:tetratricopeptide (TPR) repeat protein
MMQRAALAVLAAAIAAPAFAQAPPRPAPRARAKAAATPAPPTISPELEVAAARIDRGELPAAERDLRAMIQRRESPHARGLLAVILARQEKDDEARAEIEKALKATPRSGPALLTAVGRVQSVRTLLHLAQLLAARKDAAGAVATLKRAREIAPSSEEVLTAYAQAALGTGLTAHALAPLQQLTRMHPDVARHHYLFGVALLKAGNPAGGSEELQKAAELAPDDPMTLLGLGIALNTRKLYDQSRPQLMRCLELEPGNLEAAAALAESEEGMGDHASAEAHARAVLARAPGHGTANLVMGILLMRNREYAQARDVLERSVKADPESQRALYQLSLAYARLGDEKNAARYLALYEAAREAFEKRAEEQLEERVLAERGIFGRGGMGQ